jgi:phosphomevalonate kinase
MITVSAPGKLVLIGEYSVLYGAPAVVMAIDRRATVQLEPSYDGRWSVLSPGLAPEPARFELRPDGAFEWDKASRNLSDRFVLVERVLGSLVTSGAIRLEALRPCAAVLDTREFFESSSNGAPKIGVGSSAALTAALATALASWGGRADLLEPRVQWLRRLLGFHRDFQGGRGSGIDLAASVMGGAVEYQLDDQGTVRRADALELPKDLHMLFVWTGRSADTGEFLSRLAGRLSEEGGAVEGAIGRLGELARAGIDRIRAGDADALLDTFDEFGEAMEALGRSADLQIMSDEHLQLGKLARAHGARYKPSGAGGGDIGIAFASDIETITDVERAVLAAGFRVVDLRVDFEGLRLKAV